ncbi:unnamed protein product [Rhodiola kirilowii]
MARNHLPPSVNPPEESESESEEEEDEEGVEEEDQVVADEVNRKEAGSDEEEEEDLSAKTTSQVRGLYYGSNGDSGKTIPSPSVSDFVVKQNSKIEKDKEPKKKKRLAESPESRDKSQVKKPKREKKKANGAEKDVAVEDRSKRSVGGQRIWGAEDELKLLTGMLEYKQETGVDFNTNLEAFYEYIKGSLNAVVDKNQLTNKIRKLKDKYRDNALKEANGKAPVFSKDHEAEAYDHSKKIWGGKSVSRESQGAKSNPKAITKASVAPSAPIIETVFALPVPELEVSKKKVISGSAKVASRARNRKVSRKMDLGGSDVEMKDYIIPMPAMEDNFMVKKGMELVEKSKVDALNDKWTKYQLELAQLYAKKLDLVMERTKLILDALKSNP